MRSSTGMTRSLQTMVESAIVSTITMPVAADSPPMKAKSASQRLLLRDRQRQHEGVGVDACPAGKCSSPPSAIGSTKMLIARR